jgi:hypothetical protein
MQLHCEVDMFEIGCSYIAVCLSFMPHCTAKKAAKE